MSRSITPWWTTVSSACSAPTTSTAATAVIPPSLTISAAPLSPSTPTSARIAVTSRQLMPRVRGVVNRPGPTRPVRLVRQACREGRRCQTSAGHDDRNRKARQARNVTGRGVSPSPSPSSNTFGLSPSTRSLSPKATAPCLWVEPNDCETRRSERETADAQPAARNFPYICWEIPRDERARPALFAQLPRANGSAGKARSIIRIWKSGRERSGSRSGSLAMWAAL